MIIYHNDGIYCKQVLAESASAYIRQCTVSVGDMILFILFGVGITFIAWVLFMMYKEIN